MPGRPPPPPNPGTKRPPPTPISSGAFSFSIDPTPKKAKTASLDRPPSLKHLGATSTPSAGPSRVTKTPLASSSAQTPKKTMMQTLESLPSPLNFLPPPRPHNPRRDQHKEGHKRLNDLFDDSLPLLSPSSPVKKKDEGNQVPIGTLPSVLMEGIKTRETVREDEGIGVSPRKPKGIKWTGKGPPPPSIKLASLLQSANSSLLLFYTSLFRTLHPPKQSFRASTPSRGLKQSVALPLPETKVIIPPTALQHSRTAPLLLRPTSTVIGRTHHSVILWCDILHLQQPSLTSALPGDVPGVPPASSDANNTMAAPVLVVFQSLSHEIPRTGIDPRVLVGKISESSDTKWSIGIWAPWSEVEVHLMPEDRPSRSMNEREEQKPRSHRALFASRYLIAEDSER